MLMIIMHMNQQMRLSLILLLSLVTFSCFGQVTFAQLQRLHQNEADALRQIATTLGATLVDSTDDPCQSGKLSISTANSSTIVNSIACNYTDGTFSHVTSFSVTATGISGEIPKEWGNFANLTYLSLEANQLSGSIPEELGNLVSLTDLALSSNQFVGSLPKTLANLTNLINFRISDNNFSGTVPEFIGRWNKLQRLEMYSSGLEGPISSTIFALGNLTDLRITDMIGPKFDFPKRIISKEMKYLVLRNLNMSGSIPTDIWEMDKLQTLDLTFNKLKGEINSSTTSPTYIFLSGNMLNGTIPDSFLSTRRNLDLSYNNFTSSTDCPESRPNINMYRSFTSKNNMSGLFSCPSTPSSCLNPSRSFHINCGGQDVLINQTLYEGFRDEEPYNRAGRRIFDIYIQGKLKWKDFNIKEQANGTGEKKNSDESNGRGRVSQPPSEFSQNLLFAEAVRGQRVDLRGKKKDESSFTVKVVVDPLPVEGSWLNQFLDLGNFSPLEGVLDLLGN
ncbi:hypothetical protein Q3G72_029024 [Acer saccharum]|nr:hypothetical protein Q3G72_029024 [Acer saccharum]